MLFRQKLICNGFFLKIKKLDPKYSNAHNCKGNLLSDLHQFEEALKCYEEAIKACGVFLGVPADEAVFELNLEFFMTPMTAQDRAAWMADINSGLIPRRAYYAAMRAAGLTNWSDEEIEDGLEDGGDMLAIPAEPIEDDA